MYMSVCGYMHMIAGILGDQMRVSDTWKWYYRWLWVIQHEHWELNSGLLQEKYVLLTTEPSLYEFQKNQNI